VRYKIKNYAIYVMNRLPNCGL